MASNLTVTAAANSRMLCTLANVKTQLGITGSGEDTRLTTLIMVASEQVASILEREPWLQTYLERLPGDGGTMLYLSRWPLQGDPASVTIGTGASPTTVTASTYSVAGRKRRRLYRATGWYQTQRDSAGLIPVADDRALDYNVTYTAGWVMPDEITEWSAAASVAANSWFASTDADEPFIFQADATGGTTHASTEPTWPTVAEGTVTDNDITWTAHDQRLPRPLEEIAMAVTVNLYSRAWEVPAHIKKEGGEGWFAEYRDTIGPVDSMVRSVVGMYQ